MSPADSSPRRILTLNDTPYETTFTRKFANRKAFVPKDPKRLTAIIPGLILEVLVQPGELVTAGQSLLVLEAMKMQNHLGSPLEARIKTLHVAPGLTVARGQLLLEFE